MAAKFTSNEASTSAVVLLNKCRKVVPVASPMPLAWRVTTYLSSDKGRKGGWSQLPKNPRQVPWQSPLSPRITKVAKGEVIPLAAVSLTFLEAEQDSIAI